MADIFVLAIILSPIAVLVAAPAVYSHNAERATVRRSKVNFGLGVAGAGLLGGVVGAFMGIPITCAIFQNAQCGLGGMFIFPPLFFSLTICIYFYLWAKNVVAT